MGGLVSQIASALFPSAGAAPAVRRPVFKIEFGSASADDWKQALVSFRIGSALAPAVDFAHVTVAVPQGPAVAVADTGSISAGYEDASAEPLFSGQVEAVRRTLDGRTHVTAGNSSAVLARTRLNRSYEQRTAGEIVTDLASLAGLSADTVEDGVSYPFYVIDDRRSAWRHIAALASRNGFMAWITAEGKLNFKPVSAGQPAASFTYAGDILALELSDAAAAAGAVTAIGEGAAGSNGQDAWNWLVKEPPKSDAGQGDPARLIEDASLRSTDAAKQAAAGAAGAAARLKLSGRLLVPGAPGVAPGSTIEITGAPQDELNGTCLVEAVEHRYSKRAGFASSIMFTQLGAGGAGGGLLGSLVSAAEGLL